MLSFRLVQEVYHSYLVMDSNRKLGEDDYRLNMLLNNPVPYFAVFQNRLKDGSAEYFYDVTGLSSIEPVSGKKADSQAISTFVESLCKAVDSVEEYLLDTDDIILDASCIFGSGRNTYCFIYYPGYGQKFSEQLKRLAEQLLTSVDYTNSEAVRKAYKLYHLACDENNAVKGLRSFSIGEEDTERKLLPDTGNEKENPAWTAARELCSHMSSDGEEVRTGTGSGDDAFGNEDRDPGFQYGKKNTGTIWLILSLCLCAEGALGLAAFKMLSLVDVRVLAGCTAGIMLTTLVGGLIVLRVKEMAEDTDFWQPEDFINLDGPGETNDICVKKPLQNFSEKSVTTLLSGNGTESVVTEAIFRSACKERWPDLRISRFPAVIGKDSRELSCCIRLPVISRKHARLEQKDGSVYLTDLHSSNGTFVNGEMIPAGHPVSLRHGDSVIFADVEFVFE